MREVRKERTGWRDKTLSDRHRIWGYDLPAVDLDFLEYDENEAVALIEYKNEHAWLQNPDDSSYKALIDLGNKAGLPVFAARYTDDYSTWFVSWLNKKAKEYVPERTEMTEEEWVTILYKVRGREIPPEIIEAIRNS